MSSSARVSKLAIATHFLHAHWRWHTLRGAALKRYQDEHVQRIVAFTNEHSSFYREHWRGHDLRDWRTLPLIDKQVMMAHFGDFNTRGIALEEAMEVALHAERSRNFSPQVGELTVGLSSGTSGHRGLFLVSPQEQAAWAGTMLARALHHLPRQPLRVAFFLRSNSNLYEQIGSHLIRFRYFDLMLPLNQAVAELNAFQPQILVGPPSLLGFLAAEARSGRLHIRPERLISVAEVLEEQDRARIEASFAVPVHQIYQCTEGLLAVSCARGSLHIQEDAVAIQFEPLPDSGSDRVVPIVTDLWRSTQPIIRYRLNDVLHLETRSCPCGSPYRVLKAIEGRCDDVCTFEKLEGGLRPFYPDTLRRMILLASPAISEYQVVQEAPGQLRISLEIAQGAVFDDVAQQIRESITTSCAEYGCCPGDVQIEQGITPLAAGAKRRRVIARHTTSLQEP